MIYFYIYRSEVLTLESMDIIKLYCESVNSIYPKRAFFMPIVDMVSASSLCKGSLTLVKNFYMFTIPGGIGMLRNSILYPIFDEVMRNLIPSGIPQYLQIFYSKLLFGTYEELNEKTPQVLTLNDLAFGFLLWLAACSVSIAAFVGEILRHRLVKMTNQCIGLYILLIMIRKRNF